MRLRPCWRWRASRSIRGCDGDGGACDRRGREQRDGQDRVLPDRGCLWCVLELRRFPVSIDGQAWPTSEHFFQAQKFDDPAQREKIRSCASPMIAVRLGRDRSVPIRRDWEAMKDDVMRRVVLEKFRQHEACRQLLLATGDAVIVEHTTNDAYWADGGDGSGKNMLGVILMEVRATLRSLD